MRKPLLALPLFIVTLVLLAHFSPISAQTSNNYLYLNGNVGIGTTTPVNKLQIQGPGLGTVILGYYTPNTAYGAIGLMGATLDNNGYNFASSPNDQTLYINRPPGNPIRFREGNGSDQLVIASGGNVGIGTTSPSAPLHIFNSSGGRLLKVWGATTGNDEVDIGYGDSANQAVAVGYTADSNLGYVGILGVGKEITWNGSGNVGIGTTSPGANLDVAGSTGGNVFVVRNPNDSSSYGVVIKPRGSGYSGAEIQGTNYNLTGTPSLLLNPEGGNVGIGTNTPGSVLDIVGNNTGVGQSNAGGLIFQTRDGLGRAALATYGNISGVGFTYNTASAAKLWSQSGTNWSLETAGTVGVGGNLLVNSNVGIGTTSPGAKLEVNGNTAVDGNLDIWNNGWLTVHNGTITAQGKSALVLNGGSDAYGGTYLGFYDTVGDLPGYPNSNYHIIKTDDPYINFSLAGVYSAYIDSGGGWHPVSSKTKKENFVQPNYPDILIKIDKLPVMEWNYKFQDPSIKHIGPFAEDFHSAFGLSGTDTQTIDYTDEIGVSLAGVKALSKEIKDLQKQNQDLEKRLDSLEKKVDGL